MTVILFWVCIGLLAYTYVGFPLVLALRARLFPRPYQLGDITPRVSLIIAAHNEAATIGTKLENILALDYPRTQIEVVVASDGSSDGTDEIVRRFDHRGVRLLSLSRRGKAATLNAAVKVCTGEMLVFSDANSMFHPHALLALVRPLADWRVGGVAGDQRYLRAAKRLGADEGERRYWDFDRRLKQWQSAAGHVTSATGAIYAIRRELFRTVPEGMTDDFAVSTAVIDQGYRLVFASGAIAYEPAADAADAEFARKVRIITRGLRGVVEGRSLLNPFRHGFYALQLFSHKVLRRLMALPLLLLLAVSPWLWSAGSWYPWAIVGQAVGYGCAALGWVFRRGPIGRTKLLALPMYFSLVNLASLVALANVVRGRRIVAWQPRREVSTVPGVGSVR